MTIRVVLADDQELIRAGFRAIIETCDDISVVGEAANGVQAVQLAPRADVVLMDVRMPEMDGLAATREICAKHEHVRVLILTTFELDEYVFQALRAGASGFLGKNMGPAMLLEGIRMVAGGEALLSPKATKGLITRFLAQPAVVDGAVPEKLSLLTGRELEIVTFVANGLSNDDIAGRLFLSPATVKTHLNRAMVKLGARDRAQVVVLAYQSGLVR
ncbi:response regulator transcription factor [Kibdelosporangium aridum]|uniref:DNA-binding response regulator, NarL/FixJ family, contains REC and HTH domains n=1 Tax=Kibdelosporangium aridum TaxID=2030 RepID=A0A1Y5XYI4_KIBAR|nr:response regulator transcription factor [Kibdelosporangium aridum]SMD20310.1 DNA-binding response regulator, NarL/FixJ family, contains REC and HTH domains [Kibdelosporangium aridum]